MDIRVQRRSAVWRNEAFQSCHEHCKRFHHGPWDVVFLRVLLNNTEVMPGLNMRRRLTLLRLWRFRSVDRRKYMGVS